VTGPLVLACGLTTLDVRQTVERVPGPDEKVVARDLAVEVGGPAANAATTCTALGVPARLLTRVGGAAVGRIAREDLVRHAVEVHDLAGPDDAPAVSTVLVTAGTGQRAVASVNATLASTSGAVTAPAADGAVSPDHGLGEVSDGRLGEVPGGRLDDLLDRVLDGATAVLVDGHHLDLAVPVAAAARAAGVVVVLDGGSWKPGLEALLAHVDVAVLSADFRLPEDVVPRHRTDAARQDAGAPDLLARVGDLGPSVVAQSHGGDPVEVRHCAGHARVPVPPVRAVDTLGAGDVLHGALAAWLACAGACGPSPAAGDADDVLAALEFATAVASSSVTAAGARGWTTDADAVGRLRAVLPNPT
jgi:sugar/nucleoside kinase (ribokinase family)